MNLKINEKYGNVETHIKNNFTKYVLLLIIFALGIIVGGFCFSTLKNSSEDILKLKELLEQIISDMVNNKWNAINEYFYKDLKKALILTLVSSSMIGLPLLFVWIFYDGFSLSFTISCLISAYGYLKGNLISFGFLFLPNLLYLVATMIITISSMKMVNNFFKMKKSLKMETTRHLLVCTLSVSIILISFFIRAFSMNFIENILKFA